MAFTSIGGIHFTVQETEKSGGPPTTTDFNPVACELEVIRTTWFANLGTETPAILAPNHRNHPTEDTSICGISYVVGIRNKLSNELWKCVICPDIYGTYLLVNGGLYKISVFTNPCGARITTSNVDVEGRPLRQHEGVLNVVMATSRSYTCTLVLMNSAGNILSASVRQKPALQLGPLFSLQLLIQRRGPTGVEYSCLGRKIIRHFQDLANNGHYDPFEQRFHVLKEKLVGTNCRFQDLIPRILLEGSVMALVQSKWDEFEEKANEALTKAGEFHLPNIDILRAILKYRMGTVKRLQSDFIGARECMEEAKELLQPVGPCEEVAEFHHHRFSLLADERGNSRDAYRLEPGSPEPELVYHLAIENWQRGCEPFSRVISPVDFEVRAAVRLVNYHLQTSRDRAPVLGSRVGCHELDRARSVLQFIERKPLDECQTRVLAGYHLAKTDLLLLEGSFEEGITAVKKCLGISRKLHLKKYTDGGEARLTLLLQQTGQMQLREEEPAANGFRRPSQGDDFNDLLTELNFEAAGQRASVISQESNNQV